MLYLKLSSIYLLLCWSLEKNMQHINASNATSQITLSSRIVGGKPGDIRNFPYLMQLHSFGIFLCGGTLITARHVVTAAHCVHRLKENDIMVIGGTSFLSGTTTDREIGVRRSVSYIYTSKEYRVNTMHMDVAVVKLIEDMKGQNIGSLSLCDRTLKATENIEIAGWGQSSEKGKETSSQLRSAKVPLMTRAQCRRMYKGQATITDTMFCASLAGIRDACSGDSGGPAVYHGRLCGIISFGIGCARKTYPGVYTNVHTVKPFIMNAIKQ